MKINTFLKIKTVVSLVSTNVLAHGSTPKILLTNVVCKCEKDLARRDPLLGSSLMHDSHALKFNPSLRKLLGKDSRPRVVVPGSPQYVEDHVTPGASREWLLSQGRHARSATRGKEGFVWLKRERHFLLALVLLLL